MARSFRYVDALRRYLFRRRLLSSARIPVRVRYGWRLSLHLLLASVCGLGSYAASAQNAAYANVVCGSGTCVAGAVGNLTLSLSSDSNTAVTSAVGALAGASLTFPSYVTGSAAIVLDSSAGNPGTLWLTDASGNQYGVSVLGYWPSGVAGGSTGSSSGCSAGAAFSFAALNQTELTEYYAAGVTMIGMMWGLGMAIAMIFDVVRK